MNQILDLREKRAKAWDAAKAFLDAHQNENGLMSAEDTATYERMESDVVEFGKAIDRLERQNAIEAELGKAVNKPITDAIEAPKAEKVGTASDAYKKNFFDMLRTKSMPYEMYNALQVGTDSEGGYLVPDEFERKLVDALQDANIMRRLAHVIKTSSGTHTIPVVASHGTADWTDEEAAYHESDDAFTTATLSAYKLTTMMKISEELLHDSAFDMQSYMAAEFARRIAAAEEEAFFVGNGTKKPTGVFNTAGTGASAKAGSVTFDSVMDLYYSLRAPYRNKAVFVMNDSSVKALRKLKTSNGEYLWQPSVVAGTPDTILNRPVYTSNFVDDMSAATNKPLLFGDLSYYWIADRQSRSFKRLNELYAYNGQVGFMASERVDGKLILPEAVKVLTLTAS